MTFRLTEVELPRHVRLSTAALPPLAAPERLAHPRRADDSILELSARRVRVGITGTGGIRFLEGDGVALTGPVRAHGAAGANLLAGPRGARRECFTPSGGLLESVQLPENLPGALVQWTRTGPAPDPSAPLEITVELPPSARRRGGRPGSGPDQGPIPIQYHRAPGLLWVAWADRGVLMISPGSDHLPELTHPEGALVARWRFPLAQGDPVGLLLQAAPPGASWTSPGALAGAAAHYRRGEDASWGEGEPGLVLDTGVEAMDDGLRWCRAWIRDRLLASPGAPPRVHPVRVMDPGDSPGQEDYGDPTPSGPDLFGPRGGAAWLAMAAAASGDREAGRAALGSLGWSPRAVGIMNAVALARWVAWTGETAPLERWREQVLETFRDPSDLDDLGGSMVRAVRNQVAAAGEAMGDAPLTALRLGDADADLQPALGRRLPMVGPGWEPDRTPLLLRDGRAGVSRPRRLEEALAMRRAMTRILQDPRSLGEGTAVLAILHLVLGVLGAEADALYGRITLSPLLSPRWTTFRLEGLRVGEGVIDLSYQRTGALAEWRLRPRTGSVPVTMVFQPWFPLGRLRTVRVDGEPVDVDTERDSGWARIALQLPLDATRSVEVEGEEVSPFPSEILLP